MDASRSFRMPSLIAQDIALIMSYVDPPTPTNPHAIDTGISVEGILAYPIQEPEKTSEQEDDINSSGNENEAEEVENVLLIQEDVKAVEDESVVAAKKLEESESDSDSSSSDGSSSGAEDEDEEMKKNQKPTTESRKPDPVQEDLDEDGPVPRDYLPTAHEIPLTSIPIPPLPDPTTLPNEPLELVGEIGTVLTDTIIVRGGGGSSTGHSSATEKRHMVLDEGSLLLFDDRTPLGYIWETFGPTHLPHYIVRIARRSKAPEKTDEIEIDKSIEAANTVVDKATLSRPIYHLRSTSKFVFTAALSKFKGSDASNLHDEELPEHEQEFSDDEAEAAFKRSRRKRSRAPSVARSQHYDSVPNPEFNYTDDAGSLYGDSPYDTGESNPSFQNQGSPPGMNMTQDSRTSSSVHQNPEIQRALMNARMSRRKQTSQSDGTHTTHLTSYSRSFSFEEYDPRMPRPPSPTSLAIAQATGQWSNGTPYAYGTNIPMPSYAPPSEYPYPHPPVYVNTTSPISPQFASPFPLPPSSNDSGLSQKESTTGQG